MDEKLYTTGEVARLFRVSAATIWRWCNIGTIHDVTIVGKDQRLIPETEVKRLYNIIFNKEMEA